MKNLVSTLAMFCMISITIFAQSPELQVLNTDSGNAVRLQALNSGRNVLFGENTGKNLGPANPFTGDGMFNIMLGSGAGRDCVDCVQNVLIGRNAGVNRTSGNGNTFVGSFSAEGSAFGDNNTYLGSSTGHGNNGNGNTFLGHGTGKFSSGSNNVFLGFKSGENSTGDNKLMIHNSTGGQNDVLIYGEFDNKLLRVNARQEITVDQGTEQGLSVTKVGSISNDEPAIEGVHVSSDYYGVGVRGRSKWKGVEGIAEGDGGGAYYGLYGSSLSANTGINYGVAGFSYNGQTNYAIAGFASAIPNSYAGYFSGNALITNELEVQGGIKISDTDLGSNADDDIINRTTSMKYFMAVSTGSFPSNSGGPNNQVMVGEVKLLPYSFTPAGWLPCEGQELLIADYNSLFALLGTNYGGNGTTTFRLPDMRNAIPNHN